ncbi:MAG: N-6 DNA methylase, partial [Sciscionella sp.]
MESRLKTSCEALRITWTPYTLDRTLRRGRGGPVRFVDVAHGAVVIEYEPPRSFKGAAGAQLEHAREQANEYVDLLSAEEGRAPEQYVTVAWDGAHISFGRRVDDRYEWNPLQSFDLSAAKRLLGHLRDDGAPLVHPRLLSQRVGPASEVGEALLPPLYQAVRRAASARLAKGRTTKTQLLFFEWRRLFGQVVGVPSERLARYLVELSEAHDAKYTEDPTAYLFALNTYIALVAKLVAALALPHATTDIGDPALAPAERMRYLESGELFYDAGVVNMLNGDFFSWYLDDADWPAFEPGLDRLIGELRGVNFDMTRKAPESVRDLFKGLYMTFVPSGLRHALGEYYTPDWLAAHALDTIDWQPQHSTLDPTCGSGTFLLEALRRRLAVAAEDTTAAEILDGLYGMDLNPLAVLAARASIVVSLGHRLEPKRPIRIPVYLADAANPATVRDGVYHHDFDTEHGERHFHMPSSMVHHSDYFAVMQRVRELINDGEDTNTILDTIGDEAAIHSLDRNGREHLSSTLDTLVDLKKNEWDGIWCAVLADRFAAGAVPRVRAIVGNPPWVKWSHLPRPYAQSIVSHCRELGVFSDDTWVGGIESDISTVILYRAVEKYADNDGVLAFFITGTVFANESSQGFRRWRLAATASGTGAPESLQVVNVEDYAAVAPFEGVSNHATLLVLRRNRQETAYPVPYTVWRPPVDRKGRPRRVFDNADQFRDEARPTKLLAQPVPGTDAGPWLKGITAQHEVWAHLFGAQDAAYRARKGVTTDANGVFFLTASDGKNGLVRVQNEPALGRRPVPQVRKLIEETHLFPLLRGEGVAAFRATVDPNYRVLVPQRGKDGDSDLRKAAPYTYRYLNGFKELLESRSSYKRFQQRTGAPFWSLWSTGPYTFSPFKV